MTFVRIIANTIFMRILPVLAILAPVLAVAGDWPQFRGPESNGAVDSAGSPPVEWSRDSNVAWIVDLPGEGYSQPVIVGDAVFVTGSSGHEDDRLHVTCFNADDGSQRWDRQFWATGRSNVFKPEMRVATSTPVATADRVYALFSSNDLVCLDHAGNLMWLRGLTYDYPNATSSIGMSSSPILADGTLVCQLETDDASFAIGLDAETGENRWKIDRLRKANWTSPIVFGDGNDAVVLLGGADGVQAVDPETGETRWTFDGGGSTISSVSTSGGVVFVPIDGLTAIQPAAGSSNVETLWSERKLSCSFVSPVVAQGHVYTINGAGVLTCGDAATGDILWQLRLGGNYWATPSAVGDRLYCPSKEGLVKVVDLSGEKGEIVAENEIGAPIYSPPAIVGDALYIRTDTELWKIAAE